MPEILENGGVAFGTTHWSVVLTAQSQSPASQEALEELSRVYWPPIYCFLRRKGRSEDDARELTESFLAQLLERRDFSAGRREKRRFRSYLLGSLKRFLERRGAEPANGGSGRILISRDEIRAEVGAGFGSASLSPDCVFAQQWAMTVLGETIARLTREAQHLPDPELEVRLTELFSEELDQPSLARVAREFRVTETAVKQALHRQRERYRQLLREEIAHTVAMPGEIENELRELVAALPA